MSKKLLHNKYFLLLVIVLGSFCVRYAYIDKANFASIQGGDQAIYVQIADKIVRDHVFSQEPGLRSFMPPMLPWILAGLMALFGQNMYVFYMFFFIMSAATAVLVYDLVRRLSNNWTALLAAVIFAVYEEFIYWTTHIYTETPFLFLFALTLVFAVRYVENKKMTDVFFTALFSVCTFYTRSTMLLIYPFILLYWWINNDEEWRRKLRAALVFTGMVGILLLPWSLRNYSIHKKLILGSTNGGMNFLQGNNQWAYGEKTLPPQLFPEPNYWQRPEMTEAGQEEYFYGEGWKWIKSNKKGFYGS
ncbi:MAG: glycosyltransferase family 39 protein [Endomicrobiales bacterium]|nr:glycosyltransferase family 39 protein [Endomicrobiales bacterium]